MTARTPAARSAGACKNEHYWMGVSTRLGDRLFGTFPEPTAVPTSPTCRTLGVVVGEVPQA